jgi:hypothetical protein
MARRGLAAVLAAIPIALTSCSTSALTSAQVPPPVTVPASSPAGAPGTCTAGYCVPADWDTARASTPLPQVPPFSEPLNVIVSARSTVTLAQVQQALGGNWKSVSTATEVSVAGIHIKCISVEKANVDGKSYAPEEQSWRLGGCLKGNELSLSGNELHVRWWNQAVPGSSRGAWFAAASYETMCVDRDGRLQPASANKAWTILHPGAAYHCVDGGQGTFTAMHPNGYDDAATDFAGALDAAAAARGWKVTGQLVTRPAEGINLGEGKIPFSTKVYVITIMSAPTGTTG